MDILFLLFEWIVVFVFNVIPAFAPPTWITLSYFNITFSQNIFLLIFIGVTASTVGRFVLAKLSGYVTEKKASVKKKKEMDYLKRKLLAKPFKKFVFTLLFSLSPLPSNALFIAVGATKTRLREVLAGFFIGRTISYLFLVFTTEKIFSSLQLNLSGDATVITIVIEIIGAISIITFFLIDWKKLIEGKGKKINRKKIDKNKTKKVNTKK